MDLVFSTESNDYEDGNNMTLNINPSINTQGKSYEIGATKIDVPYCCFNISNALGNTTMRYSINDGVDYSTITLAEGAYTLVNITESIKSHLTANGHSTPLDGITYYPFALYGNYALAKFFVVLNSVQYSDVKVDFSNNGSSLLYKVLGFTPDVISVTNTLGINRVQISPYGFFYITCDIADPLNTPSYKIDMKKSVYVGNFSGKLNGSILDSPTNPDYIKVRDYDMIRSVNVQLRLSSGELYDTHGERVFIKLHLREVE